ncbi:hypothetical protein C7S16_4518 [Burkholderia thailandensis]|uniref:AraC family transcriptional regulator n=1 Tax=Burkholderia thailandensis TaxID=57975 RepID=A0AAW9CND2_BURTH|nr:hypothetical protein [Burkholderia thailandensis]
MPSVQTTEGRIRGYSGNVALNSMSRAFREWSVIRPDAE